MTIGQGPTISLIWTLVLNMRVVRRFSLVCGICLLLIPSSFAQTPTSDGQGFTPYATFQGGDIDSINLSTGNVVIKIPLLSYPQRGGKLRLVFNFYDTNKNWWVYNNGKVANWTFANNGTSNPFLPGGPYVWPDQSIRGQNSNYSWTDTYKDVHQVFQEHAITSDSATHAIQIANPVEAGPGWTADGTAIWFNGNATTPTFIDSDGIEYTSGSATNLPGNVIDSNGNEITYSGSGWTDTLGRQIPGYPTSGTMTTAPGVAASTTNCPSGTISALQWNVPAPGGATATYYFCYANFSYQTDFGYSGVSEASGQNLMISAIVLPNSTMWIFNYDSYLSISSITLPTGGTITYTWATINVAPPVRAILSRTVNANDGTGPHTWNYDWTGTGTENLTVTDPLGNETVVTSPTGYVSTLQTYTGSGTLLKTVDNTYTTGAEDQIGCCGGNGGLINIFLSSSTVTWPNGYVMQTATTQYDPGFTYGWFQPNGGVGTVINRTALYGLPVNQTVSDYGSGAPGAVLKQTNTVYYWQNNSNYLTANLLNLPQTVTIEDGNGNPCAKTVYTYDNSSYLVSSGIGTQHTTSLPGPVRGDISTVTRELTSSTNPCVASPSWTPITNSYYVYDTGTTNYVLDPLNNKTAYQYSTAFAGAYPTQITNALSQSVYNNYDFNAGAVISTTDPNNNTTNYSYDAMARPTQIQYPDGGETSYCYTDEGGSTCSHATTPPYDFVVTKQTGTSAGPYTNTVVYDGLGRVSETQLNSDPDCSNGGGDKVDRTYDADGRVYSVSNPYCVAGESTSGLTTYSYDGLNRVRSETHPDGTVVTTSYTGRATQVQDEGNGSYNVTRISQVDGLGRLTSVCELSSQSLSGQSGTPASCNLDITPDMGFLTTYGYDTLGNLTQVSQGTMAPRQFAYDSLSRLLNASNPESGTTTYSYDADGNLITRTSPGENQAPGTASVTISGIEESESGQGQNSINLVQQASADNGASISNSVVVTLNGVAAGDLLTCSLTYDTSSVGGSNALSLSDNVNGSWSVAIPAHYSSAITQTTGMFYFANSQAGNIMITGSAGGTFPWGAMACQEWSGAATTSPLEQETQQDGTTALPSSGSITTTANGDLILGNLENMQQPAAGTGFTLIDSTPSTWLSTEYQIQTSAGTTAATWHGSGTITAVQQSSTDNSGNSSSTVAVTLNGVTSGDLLTCDVTFGANTTITVSDSINGTWSIANALHYNAGLAPGSTVARFYKQNSAAGNMTITATGGTAAQFDAMNCQEWSGAATSNVLDQNAQQDGTTANPSTPSVTTAAGGELILGNIVPGGNGGETVGSGFTLLTVTSATGLGSEYEMQSSPGAVSATWNMPAQNWTSQIATLIPAAYTTAQVAAFKPASGAGTIYDSGSVWITVNGVQYSTSYGQNSNASTVADLLTNEINQNGSASVTANVHYSTVYLTATTTGSSTDYSLSAGSSSSESFSPPSFSATASSSSLTNGSSGSQTTTTSYQYDPLNRILSKSYNDNFTPTASFVYDVSSLDGLTFTNPVGRLVEESTAQTSYAQPTATWNSYDKMGRIVNQWQECPTTWCVSSPYSLPYSYDLMGHMKTIGNPFFTLTYQYDGAGRVLSVTTSLDSSSYPPTLLSGAIYNAAGKEVSATLGNGLIESFTYDKRFRPLSYSAGSTYSWTIPTSNGYAPDGDVLAANDSVNGDWTYSYDQFNRLEGSNKNNGADVYSYVYDRYGNRWQQNGPYLFLATFTGNNPANPQNNNRMDGYPYDLAGNLLSDRVHTYTYDAENRVVLVDGANTAIYVYDAEGRRVKNMAIVGNVMGAGILYDLNDHPFVWINSGGWSAELYAGGRHLATYSASSTFWSHTDWLGTERAHSAVSGALAESNISNPFGDALAQPGNGSGFASPLFFTGKERDSESNLDNFGARYFGSSLGRFMSPDPSSVGGDIVDSENPQAWDMYSYVLNNPLNATDPDGLDYWLIGGNQCGQNNIQCDNEGYVLDNNGNRVVITDQQLNGSNGLAKFDENGNLIFTTSQGTFQGQFFDPNPVPPSAIVTADYHDMLFDALVQGTQMAQPGVNAAVAVTAPQYLFMAGVSLSGALSSSEMTTLGEIRPGPGASKAGRLVAQGGKKALQRAIRSLSKKIAEHEAKIQAARASGGFTSSMEAEVANWKAQIQAMENILRTMP